MIDFFRPEIVTAIKDQARKHDGPGKIPYNIFEN